jgi:four helix bundle protein
MKINKFEDLECWKEARILTQMVYKLVRKKEFSKDFRLSGQITAASVSVMNNIAEGFSSQSNSELVRFLTYSRRSTSEVQNCLYVSLDQAYITKTEFEETFTQAERTRQIIDGFIRYLRTQRK